jgi:ABC-type amino acid transport substrate-binding protein
MPAQRRTNSREPAADGETLEAYLKAHNPFRSQTELAEKAGIKQSVLSGAVGDRALSVAATLKVARALCAADPAKLEETARTIYRLANNGKELRASELSVMSSAADRVELREKIRVAYVSSDPFVRQETGRVSGFAVDVWSHLASLMGIANQDPSVQDLKDVPQKLADQEVDIVVTALLPTYGRRRRIAFSRPLPYLGIPLSAIVKTSFQQSFPGKSGFSAGILLEGSTDRRVLGLFEGAKLLLVRGEVATEFVEAFFDSDIKNHLMGQALEYADSLDPSKIAQTIDEKDVDLFVADVGTCKAVLEKRGVQGKYQAVGESRGEEKHSLLAPVRFGKHRFAQLGLYRIAFGLPKADEPWQQLVDKAFDALMTEGIRSLLALYRKYIDGDARGDSFLPFLIEDDDTIQSSMVKLHFQPLIRRALQLRDKRKGTSA